MPPSHGSTGFAAIKSGAKNGRFAGTGSEQKPLHGRPASPLESGPQIANRPCKPALQTAKAWQRTQAAPGSAIKTAPGSTPRPFAKAEAALHTAASALKRSGKSTQTKNAAYLGKDRPRLLCFSLSFQEQIQGLKNASIARFQGLCCYQSRSETSDGFRGGFQSPAARQRKPGAGLRRRLPTFRFPRTALNRFPAPPHPLQNAAAPPALPRQASAPLSF